mmetsp:Transcript_45541/g.117741  ORF Transcript_45541/g.117741 Transcript_45541/m.117741 type:complete len:269 (-) Transcript_45541:325-1131(-)|eukprot:CAMPEP_0195057656 /NCGR_PEP_ID=MMETSP0448-20130528/5729_1 /TAXON_ID=66468 /ORGANISM="Heterocapsa triquestra, Strain CCMP 448" /LENGTH=268 /DNA_ID=CAMNT_0040087679 /DNA_START=130 /DNA_END=936 /DNA_ORIENTATION=-
MTVYFDMPAGYKMHMWPDSTAATGHHWGNSSYGDSSASTGPRNNYWGGGSMWGTKHYDGYGVSVNARARATSWSDFSELPQEPDGVFVINSTSSGAYASLVADAATADIVGVDAEWVPDWDHGSDNPISVLQLAFVESRRVYVLQLGPLGGKPPQAIQMMLVNPEVTKVGFAISSKDAEKFRSTGIAITEGSMMDVQYRCATMIGMDWAAASGLSLKRAASDILGCMLLKDKRCACSDWSSEKLTPEQVRYAALDAWVALRLYYAVSY